MICAILLAVPESRTAHASPWTVPDDELAILTSLDFSFAEEEFILDGTRQDFPLNGRFLSTQFTTTLRYGFTEDFEGGMTLRPKMISYRADPVILPKETAQPTQNLVDFSSQQFGMGDVDLFARYQIVDAFVVVSTETRGQLPTGYQRPTGTSMDENSESSPVEDDATLGDGRAHLQQSLFAGTYIPSTRTFVRADAGYRLIFGGVGDQVRGGLKVGQNIMGTLIPFVSLRGGYTVYEGESVGQTAIARDPGVPSEAFEQSNIRREPLLLDRNYLKVTAGLIVPLEQSELQISYARIIDGVNIPTLNTVSMGLSTRLPDVTGESDR